MSAAFLAAPQQQRPTAMRTPVFLRGIEFRRVIFPRREEIRVATETALAARYVDDFAVPFGPSTMTGCGSSAWRTNTSTAGDGRALPVALVGEVGDQFLVIALIGFLFAGIGRKRRLVRRRGHARRGWSSLAKRRQPVQDVRMPGLGQRVSTKVTCGSSHSGNVELLRRIVSNRAYSIWPNSRSLPGLFEATVELMRRAPVGDQAGRQASAMSTNWFIWVAGEGLAFSGALDFGIDAAAGAGHDHVHVGVAGGSLPG